MTRGFFMMLLPAADKSLSEEDYDKFLNDFLFTRESDITLLIYFECYSCNFATFSFKV